MKIVNIHDFKQAKKLKSVSKDLKTVDKILTNQLISLVPYKKYVPIKHLIDAIIENKAYLNIYLKKIEKELKGVDETE